MVSLIVKVTLTAAQPAKYHDRAQRSVGDGVVLCYRAVSSIASLYPSWRQHKAAGALADFHPKNHLETPFCGISIMGASHHEGQWLLAWAIL